MVQIENLFSGCAVTVSGSLTELPGNTPISGSIVTEDFFDILGRGGRFQYYWSNPQNSPIWFESGSPIELPDWEAVYFNVNPSRTKLEGKSRGNADNVMGINCLYGEFDRKDGWEIEGIEALSPTPSVIINSGGGWHCYWLFKETIILTDQNMNRIKEAQSGWVRYIGSDPNAKDLARVLRVPGSQNKKYGKPIEVTFYQVNLKLLYDFEELEGYLIDIETLNSIEIVNPYQDYRDKTSFAINCLGRISPKRVENYIDWIDVGMSLQELGDPGLQLWDDWSKKSDKYRLGDCAARWESFKSKGRKRTLGSLIYWADLDSPYQIGNAPKKAIPEDYTLALSKMGLTFKLNECNDDIIINGTPINDIVCATIFYQLKNHGYGSIENTEIAWKNEANNHRFHPIVEYLEGLSWDGNDHISKLCSFFEDEQNVFPTWIKRWLIGCVAKVLATPKGQQNRMLILDGRQDLGKSFFVRWLCSPVPAYHIESPINPEDKDCSIRVMGKWIWEVSELGATTRRADRDALKSFLTEEKFTERKSYGHYDTVKPALANFIGTVNNEIGFLSDPTGSRRFMSCTLTKIDWKYSTEVDINQLWAQSVTLFKSGEPWNLTEEEKDKSNQINRTYEVENPLIPYLQKYFEIDSTHKDWIMPTVEILEGLRSSSFGGMDASSLQRNIAIALNSLGLEKGQKRIQGYANPVRVWLGISKKNSFSFPED